MATNDEAELLSPEQAEKAWWDAWYTADYSWEGLAKKPWAGFSVTESGHVVVNDGPLMFNGDNVPWSGEGGSQIKRPATVQDYWRLDPGSSAIRPDDQVQMELRKAETGRTYHVAHYPYKDAELRFTDKADWDVKEFERLMIRRLSDQSSFQFAQYNPPVLEPPEMVDYRAQFQGVVLIGKEYELFVQAKILFKQSCFCEAVKFGSQYFSDGAYFTNSIFCKSVDFSHIQINHAALFNFCIFIEGVNFARSHVSGICNFEGSTFLGKSIFNQFQFVASTSFQNAKFLSSSNDPTSGVDFINSTFSADANFSGVLSQRAVAFLGCRFNSGANFAGAIFYDLVQFTGATFRSTLNFYKATFRFVSFQGCDFPDSAGFEQAIFLDDVVFANTSFAKTAYFKGATFKANINFKDAVFSDVAHFDDIIWPSTPALWTNAFDRALFKSHAVFTGALCQSFAAFNGAKLERGIRFDPGDEVSNKQTLKKEMPPETSKSRDALLLSLEGGCRVLKQAMAYASDPLREQEFYRFELKARRAQTRSLKSEKFVSRTYELVSDYGSSIFRPIWLALG